MAANIVIKIWRDFRIQWSSDCFGWIGIHNVKEIVFFANGVFTLDNRRTYRCYVFLFLSLFPRVKFHKFIPIDISTIKAKIIGKLFCKFINHLRIRLQKLVISFFSFMSERFNHFTIKIFFT